MKEKNQLITLLLILIWAVLTAVPEHCRAQSLNYGNDGDDNDNDYLLIITSYAHDSKNVSEFTEDFITSSIKLSINLETKIESMGVLSLSNCYEWHSIMKEILHRQNFSKLKGILLVGQEAWATYLSLDSIPDIPFYGCKISDSGISIPKTRINVDEWEPESISTIQLAQNHGSCGGVMFDFDIIGTIQMAMRLCPDTKTIALITDNSYGGLSILAKYRKLMKDLFPQLKSIELDGRKLTVPEIRQKIDSMPQQTIILLGSWRVGKKGTFYLDRTVLHILENRPEIPIFSITGMMMRKIAVGGKIPTYKENYQDFLEDILPKIIDGHPDPIFIKLGNHYEVNMQNIEKLGLNKKMIPPDALEINDIDEKLSRYKRYTMILAIMICTLFCIIIIVIYLMIKVRGQNEELSNQKIALEKSEERAKKSDELKSRFLANLSHEVNTPANGLLGFTQVLEEKIPNFESEYSREIKECTYKLLDVINKIVEYSKLDTGTLEFDIEKFDVNTEIAKVLKRIQIQCSKNLEFTSICPLDECIISWDKTKTERILTILGSNAIKFTHKGTVTLGYYPTKTGITLYVQDTGVGICKSNQKRIFEKFEKLDEFSEGSGLGLAYIKELSEHCGGKVKVVSKPDVGSRFIVDIPCEIITPIDNYARYDMSEELYDPDTLISSELDNSLKILVAEDSDVNYLILEQIMKNHNLTRAKNGLEAVSMMKSNWYDLVLMDIRMPMMDGLAATQEIRKFDHDTPIIAITAFAYDTDLRKAQDAGCNDLINKPISRKSIFNAILKLM